MRNITEFDRPEPAAPLQKSGGPRDRHESFWIPDDDSTIKVAVLEGVRLIEVNDHCAIGSGWAGLSYLQACCDAVLGKTPAAEDVSLECQSGLISMPDREVVADTVLVLLGVRRTYTINGSETESWGAGDMVWIEEACTISSQAPGRAHDGHLLITMRLS